MILEAIKQLGLFVVVMVLRLYYLLWIIFILVVVYCVGGGIAITLWHTIK